MENKSSILKPIRVVKTNKSLISKSEVSKLIDMFKVLNKIIEINLGPDLILIDSTDLHNFKLIVNDLNKNFNKDNFEYNLYSNRKFNFGDEIEINAELTRAAFCKYFILLISYLIHYMSYLKSKNVIEYLLLTLKLLKKLYNDNVLLEKEISIILKFILLMSQFTTIFTDNKNKRGKNIKNVLYIWLVISFITSLFEYKFNKNSSSDREVENKINSINFLINDIIDFLNEFFLVNMNNISILGDSIKFLTLLELNKCDIIHKDKKLKIIKSVVKVYGNKYDLELIAYLMKNIRKAFVNTTNIFYGQNKFNENFLNEKTDLSITPLSEYEINNNFNNNTDTYNLTQEILCQDLKIIDGILEFLKFSYLQEKENNTLKIQNGFVMNENLKTGIILSPIISFPKKGYTLIFSFKWVPENENINTKMNLFCLVQEKEKPCNSLEEFTELNQLSIYIENSKLHISTGQKEHLDTKFIVIPNKSYLISIIQLQPGIFYSHGKSKISIIINNIIIFSEEIAGYPSGNMKCQIGFQNLFCDLAKVENKKKIENTEKNGNYFSGLIGTVILFDELFNYQTISKLNDLKGHYEEILFRNYEYYGPNNYPDIYKALNYFDKLKLEQKVVMLISSKSIVKSSCLSLIPKYKFKENYAEFNLNKKISMINRKFEIFPSTQSFENKKFLNEFLDLDGIKFLSLLFIYCVQIPKSLIKENNILWDKISNTIVSTLDLVLLLIESADIEYYSTSYDCFFYYMNNLVTQESLIAIFNSCMKHNFEGLISIIFLNKILSFTYVYDLNLKQIQNKNNEYKEFKNRVSILISEYIKLCVLLKRSDVIIEYFNFIKKEENIDNSYLCYKLLKYIYFVNMKDNLFEILSKFPEFNLITFCIELIKKLEYNHLMVITINDINYINTIPKDEIISKISFFIFLVSELLKSLCIRIIDDLYIKIEKNKLIKASYSISDNIIANNTQSHISPINISLSSSKLININNKYNMSASNKTNIKTKGQTYLINAKNSFKYSIIDNIVELIIPSKFTFRSIFLTIFETPNPSLSFQYIKKGNQIDFGFYNKDAMVIVVKMIEMSSSLKSNDSVQLDKELLIYSFGQVLNFLRNILDKYISNIKCEKDIKKIFNDIFESNKICLKLFFCCLNSNLIDYPFQESTNNKEIEQEKNKILFENEININSNHNSEKEEIINSLKEIINKTISKHQNPFYFNLIIDLYTKTIDILLVIELIDFIINEILSRGVSYSKCIISNFKNVIIMLYSIIFTSNFTSTNSSSNITCQSQICLSKKFGEILILFILNLAKNQILYTRLQFSLASKKNTSNNKKQKIILEMVIEILIEMYDVNKDDKYLHVLENILILNKHSIFYYMDLFYYFSNIKSETVQIKFDKRSLDLIENGVFKDGNVSIYYIMYYFLAKIFVNIWYLNNNQNKTKNENKNENENENENENQNQNQNQNENENENKNENEEEDDHKYSLLNKLLELLINDIISLYNKINIKSLDGFIKVEIKDSIYNELKQYFEKHYLNTTCNENEMKLLKIKMNEILNSKQKEIKKYRLFSDKYDKLDLSINQTISKEDLTFLKRVDSYESILSKKNKIIDNTFKTLNVGNSKKDSPLKDNTNNDINSSVFEYTAAGEGSSRKDIQSKQFSPVSNKTFALNFLNEQKYLKSESMNSSNRNSYNITTFTPNSQSKINSSSNLINIKIENETNSVCSFSNLMLNKPKRDLFLGTFSVLFKENYFYNSLFNDELKKNYYNLLLEEKKEKFDKEGNKTDSNENNENIKNSFESSYNNGLKYPVKIKNMFTQFYLRPFLKPDLNFFWSKYFKISHDYYSQINNSLNTDLENKTYTHNSTKIISEFIKLNHTYTNIVQDDIIETFKCELISLEGVIFGTLIISTEFIIFKSEFIENLYHPKSNSKYNEHLDYVLSSLDIDIIYSEKEIKIYFKDIREILTRRFLFQSQANEFFMKNGKSYFFNLFKKNKNDQFFKIMEKINDHFAFLNKLSILSNKHSNEINKINLISKCKKYINNKDNQFTKKWLSGEISNFEYILILNKFSGRSFQDSNQYPIFPWVLTNYTDKKLDINDKNNFRSFNYPVSIQNEEKRQVALKRYDDDSPDKFQLHFRCHYSTSAFNSYYLMRLNPFTQNLIRLQTDKFDHPNRIFNGFKETWEILEKYNDNRELTPEFFYLPETFINLNYNNFGIRTDNKRINNLKLPDWASDPIDFIYKHRQIFDSKFVSQHLNNWIDLIFGSNQLVKHKDSLNVFNKYSYEQEIDLEKKLDKLIKQGVSEKKIISKIRNKINLILNFGQTPHKLFDEKHPKQEFLKKESNSDEFTFVSEIVRSKKIFENNDFKKGVRYFNFSSSYIYVLNGDKEIVILDKIKLKNKNKICLKHFLFLDTFIGKNQDNNINANTYSNSKSKNTKDPKIYNIYRDKYSLIEIFDSKYFITCRHIDESIKIHPIEGNNIKEILCDSFVCSISKYKNDQRFLTGHNNGKLTCWNVEILKENNNISIKPYHRFTAHEDAINCILINEKFNILITGGEDGYVMIRNLYDFELINCFKAQKCESDLNRVYKVIDIVMSDTGLLYVTIFNMDKFILLGYTLNGLKFCSREGLFNNVEVTRYGLVFGLYDINRIFLAHHVDFKTNILFEKILDNDLDSLSNSALMTHFSLTQEDNFIQCGYLNGRLRRCAFTNEAEYEKINLL